MPNILQMEIIKELCTKTHTAYLMHNTHDDSRYVELESGVKIKFDSSLNVQVNNSLAGYILNIDNTYYFVDIIDDKKINLEINCNDWHWKNLMQAEINAAIELSKDIEKQKSQRDVFSDSAFEEFVKNELGDVAVKDQGRYISPKIQKG